MSSAAGTAAGLSSRAPDEGDFTARLVKSAIESGFCAYDYLQLDPAMAAFRKAPQYPALLTEAKQCRDRFLAERDQPQQQ